MLACLWSPNRYPEVDYYKNGCFKCRLDEQIKSYLSKEIFFKNPPINSFSTTLFTHRFSILNQSNVIKAHIYTYTSPSTCEYTLECPKVLTTADPPWTGTHHSFVTAENTVTPLTHVWLISSDNDCNYNFHTHVGM